MSDAISQWALALAAAIDNLRPSGVDAARVDAERRLSRTTNEARLDARQWANGNGGVSVSRSLSGLNRVTGCRQSRVSGQSGRRSISAAERERAAALTMQLSFSEASSKAAGRTPKEAPPWWGMPQLAAPACDARPRASWPALRTPARLHLLLSGSVP